MIERTSIRTALAVGALVCIAQLIFTRFKRRKAQPAKRTDRSSKRKPEARRKTRSIVELAGSVKSPVFGVSVEEMNSRRENPAQARLLRLAAQVWDDAADASAWLSTPHRGLGGKMPIEAAMTDAGAQRVEAILWRRHMELRHE
ncbi:antitoxin Xre/MbcA/ParS toxin-binding domain-containing protein [Paraburkholderia youngii]|uniref:antitoxin Xre/MbcA/ParS toxin-binding domain-containing protein n=1 Tax=Paraburkholderia youngii TaxID=2782701 RepID=UPI003D22E0B4